MMSTPTGGDGPARMAGAQLRDLLTQGNGTPFPERTPVLCEPTFLLNVATNDGCIDVVRMRDRANGMTHMAQVPAGAIPPFALVASLKRCAVAVFN